MKKSDKNLLVVAGLIGAAAYFGGSVMVDPIGIRNNNPGNIRRTDINWQGKINSWTGEYEKFGSPFYGIRALARNLLTYYERDFDTVAKIINRWAPPSENPTQKYIEFVAGRLNVSPTEQLYMPAHIIPLVKAIIQFENGQQPYETGLIKKAVKAAGWSDESIVGRF